MKSHRKDFDGKLKEMYDSQKQSSKVRGHPNPDYTFDEFFFWALTTDYAKLYRIWVEFGYSRKLAPSADRLDDDLPYTLDNIQMVNWAYNDQKNREQIRLGYKGQQARRIAQLDGDGNILAVFYSKSIAAREVGANQNNIGQVCRGLGKSSGGYGWKYLSIEEYEGYLLSPFR